MYKVIWLLKRKPGITFEQFRDHYENSHARLGDKYFGHLLSAYRRNYNVRPEDREGSASPVDQILAAKGFDYDCITEWELADEAAFLEIIAALGDKEIGKVFYDDEEHFLDRASVRLVRCDMRDRVTAPGD